MFSLPVQLKEIDFRIFLKVRDDAWGNIVTPEEGVKQFGDPELKKFPLSVPFAVLQSGEYLYESSAILWCLGEMSREMKHDTLQQTKVMVWLMKVEEIQSRYQQCRIWGTSPGSDFIDKNGALDRVLKQYESFLLYMESTLSTEDKFLVGCNLSVADLKVASLLEWMESCALVFPAKYDHLKNVSHWMKTMAQVTAKVRSPLLRGPGIPASQSFCNAVSLRRRDYLQIFEIYKYWFGMKVEERRRFWFRSGKDVDDEIREKFLPLYEEARSGSLEHWRYSLKGCVALVILLDQFPRNMFRGTAEMFSTDCLALNITRQCFEFGPKPYDWENANRFERLFLALVYEHQESEIFSKKAVEVLSNLSNNTPQEEADFWERVRVMAKKHLQMIEKFGRLPYRNELLNRPCTEIETQFLNNDMPAFAKSVSGNVDN
eukprot:CAMPEP_0119155268 /NCGR_PEP_ID=MMETSP1310-20130426/51659_1 /TAXON_ID=464262 /ORGANISM="Genus nov. species nov., Strain RCC2339" /LENGTH=430 /DNA_ID=CAMNT_0007147859 /DNA_START=89 /DNA_END=1381 /DNA_ORIENTATION=-